jgi:Protein of unknown function (DUF1566)
VHETRISTASMRQEILERAERCDPAEHVVLTVEYLVRAEDERRLVRLLDDLDAATAGAGGRLYSDRRRPLRASHSDGYPRDAIRYVTNDGWKTPADFVDYWRSEAVRQFHRAVEPLQYWPSRIELSIGKKHVDTEPAPAPGPTPPPTTGRVRVLRTGQKLSWDANGDLRDANACARDDGDLEEGATYQTILGPTRFIDNGDGTVTDQKTDLIWLKNANMFGEVPWEQALGLAGQLAGGAPGLGDKSRPGDWRLPNLNEMQSLLDLNNTFGPALLPESPFLNLEPSNYWTSSSVSLAPVLNWFVALAVGPPVFDLKMNSMRMWPVRGQSKKVARTGLTKCYNSYGIEIPCRGTGQDADKKQGVEWPVKRFTDNDNGTVTDNLTGLVWLQDADAFGRLNWQDALDACNGLKEGDKHCRSLKDESRAGDWRLPNVNELRSLIDYSEVAPAVKRPNPFGNIQSTLYWSSTTVASSPRFARFVFIGVGPSVWDHKSVLMCVWPVRDPLSTDTSRR